MAIGLRPLLAIVILPLLASRSFAGDDNASGFTAGELRTFHAATVYGDVRACGDAGGGRDLIAVIGGNDPVRLAPGMCEWDAVAGVTICNGAGGMAGAGGRLDCPTKR